jgi:hypothetical protein
MEGNTIASIVHYKEPDEAHATTHITFIGKKIVLICTLVDGAIDFTKAVEIEFRTGDRYFGHINTNIQLCGYGRIQFLSSSVLNYVDLWHDNSKPILSKMAIISYKNFYFYNGHINENFQRHGYGIAVFPKNAKYPIQFLYGKFENGAIIENSNYTIIYKNKNVYIGNINKKYQRHGLGVLYDENGNVLQDGWFINSDFVFDEEYNDIGNIIYEKIHRKKREIEFMSTPFEKLLKYVKEIKDYN